MPLLPVAAAANESLSNGRVRAATALFLIVAGVLGLLVLGVWLMTVVRRRSARARAGATAARPPLADAWVEAGRRAEEDAGTVDEEEASGDEGMDREDGPDEQWGGDDDDTSPEDDSNERGDRR